MIARNEQNKHITEPDFNGYQVRIVRSKKEHSRYFAFKCWGGKRKALYAARSWRDQMLPLLGRVNKYLIDRDIQANKVSTGIRGVTRTIQYDKRRDYHSLIYGVRWQFNKVTKNRTFFVAEVSKVTPDNELHAFRTACRFRFEYELYEAGEINFEPERFKDWKKIRMY